MADAPEAAAPATEATPTTNPEPAQAPAQEPEITAEQVAKYFGASVESIGKLKGFVESNGYDAAFKKLRTDVSTPAPAPEQKPVEEKAPESVMAPTEPTSPQPQPAPQTPAGAITQDEMMAKYYFETLSKDPKYATISKEIADGSLLKEMASLGIEVRNPDGSFNDARINTYLGIKAQTVPATPTSAEPDASSAPTVDYANVGEKIESMEQARRVMSQPGHPMMKEAHEYLKSVLNPQVAKNDQEQK